MRTDARMPTPSNPALAQADEANLPERWSAQRKTEFILRSSQTG
jgi:hypothetical protein